MSMNRIGPAKGGPFRLRRRLRKQTAQAAGALHAAPCCEACRFDNDALPSSGSATSFAPTKATLPLVLRGNGEFQPEQLLNPTVRKALNRGYQCHNCFRVVPYRNGKSMRSLSYGIPLRHFEKNLIPH